MTIVARELNNGAAHMSKPEKQSWFPFRFRLMTLVWLMLVVAITLGWWSERNRAIQLKRQVLQQKMEFEAHKSRQAIELYVIRERSERKAEQAHFRYQQSLNELLPIPDDMQLRPVVRHVTLEPTLDKLEILKHYGSIMSLTLRHRLNML